MHRKFTAAAFAASMMLTTAAYAASVVVTGIITGQPSTSVTCAPVASPLMFPLAPNTLICPISVQPTGWSGVVTVSDTVHFATANIGGSLSLVSGPTSPPVGPFSVTVTTTP